MSTYEGKDDNGHYTVNSLDIYTSPDKHNTHCPHPTSVLLLLS